MSKKKREDVYLVERPRDLCKAGNQLPVVCGAGNALARYELRQLDMRALQCVGVRIEGG